MLGEGEMGSVVSVHFADVGVGTALRFLRKVPNPADLAGLRHADIGALLPMSPSPWKMPTCRRVGLLASWEDDEAVDEFIAENPLAQILQGGWHARLEPLRAFGSWPGLPPELERGRDTEYRGPAMVVTYGQLRLSQTVRFLRTSAKAEAAALAASGLTWTTGVARGHFVATCSLWTSTRALATYAYGRRDQAHPEAIDTNQRRPFFSASANVRFRPYRMEGSLSGRNPLPPQAMAPEA